MSENNDNAVGNSEEYVTVQTTEAETVSTLSLPTHAQSMQLVDALLKSHTSLYQHFRSDALLGNTLKLFLIAAICLGTYGIIMGAFSGHIQWVAAPIKIVLGAAFSTLLCYPSLYILAALSGANLRPAQVAALLASTMALVGILLVGFAPVAFVFTFSIQALPFMGMVHLLVWLTSLYFGMRYAARGIQALGGKDTAMVKVWVGIFLLTLLQMSTTLRPILGTETHFFTTEKRFFLVHWMSTFKQKNQWVINE